MKWLFPKRIKWVVNGLSILYVLLGCCFYSWTVYIRDEYPTRGYLVNEWSSFIPYIISGLIIAFCIIANCVKKEKVCVFFCSIGLFFVVLGYICIVFHFVNYLNIKKTYEQEKHKVNSINLDELDYILHRNANQYVYIGRDSCSVCQDAYPLVEKYASTISEPVYYYDTEQDRYNNKQEMEQILDEINVDEVPTVLMFEDGEVKEYTGDSLWELVQ